MNKQKVLVTGGAGYIGAHTALALIQQNHDVCIVDDLSKSDLTLIEGITKVIGHRPDFHHGDCADRKFMQEIFRSQKFDCVLHFAAYKSVGESVSQPLMYHKNNIGSLITLLEVMKEFSVKDIIFSSSCTVYGQPDHIPVNEDTPFKRAESPYGATKQICERILEDTWSTGYRVISLRYFNPIGAHPGTMLGELPIGVPNNLVPFVTQAAAGKRPSLTVFGNDYDTPDGSCIRDFIHVEDVAEAHIRAMDYLQKQKANVLYETFNLGTGVGVSVLELINEFEKVTGVKVPYTIGPRRKGDVVKVYADPSKLNKAFGWKTKYSISDALLHAWKWEEKLTAKQVHEKN
jgi:UDP-glucose 4-epimerase